MNPLLRRIMASPANPLQWRSSIRLLKILNVDYGYLQSVAKQSCVDAQNNPIPWYTYPAIEFLKQLDFHDRVVFEYGSGNSTLFWSRTAKRVISVDHDVEWHRRVSAQAPPNCELLLETEQRAYIDCIDRFPETLDVIVVDGLVPNRTRSQCAKAAIRRVNEGGMVILDNSDWLPASSRLLRDAGLLEVDMSGFGPINPYTWTTSFYFKRNFNIGPKGERQPALAIGAMPYNWEPLLEREMNQLNPAREVGAAER